MCVRDVMIVDVILISLLVAVPLNDFISYCMTL